MPTAPSVEQAPASQSSAAQPSAAPAEEAWRSAPPPVAPTTGEEAWRSAPPPSMPAATGFEPRPYSGTPDPASPYPSFTRPETPAPNATIPLVLGLVALVVSVAISWMTARAYATLAKLTNGTLDVDTLPQDSAAANAAVMEAGLWVLSQGVPSLLGVLALVFAIRAMRHPSSRTTGVIALIVAIAAPIISFVLFVTFFFMQAGPYMPQ